MRVVAHARLSKGHTALNHKKTEKSKPATSQPPTWLYTRPRCTPLEGANAEPKIRLATPKHNKTKTFSKQQSDEQHRVTSNILFNTNLSATTARDLHATKVVNVRRRDCAASHLKRKLRNSFIHRVNFEIGTCNATRFECLGRMFFSPSIKHRISPNTPDAWMTNIVFKNTNFENTVWSPITVRSAGRNFPSTMTCSNE